MVGNVSHLHTFETMFAKLTEEEKNSIYWVIGSALENAEEPSHANCIRLDQK